MAVFMDVYGNEARELIAKEQFSFVPTGEVAGSVEEVA